MAEGLQDGEFDTGPRADWLHSGPPGNGSCWGPSYCFGEGGGGLKWWVPGQCTGHNLTAR